MTERIPSEYFCPISMELMKDPVVLCEDGHTYDREGLEKWLRTHNTSPMTNKELVSRKLVPNYALKSLIQNCKVVDADFHAFSIKPGAAKYADWSKLPRINLQLCLIGDSAVGKTSLLSALEYGSLPPTLAKYESTIGIEFRHFHLDRLFREKYVVNIRIDDTGGQEMFHSITPLYIRSANGILFVADGTCLETLHKLETFWFDWVKKHKSGHNESVLICNKLDDFERCDAEYRANFLARATEIATQHRMSLFSTSAYRGDNVQKSVKTLILRIFENAALMNEILHAPQKTRLVEKPKKKKSGCCS